MKRLLALTTLSFLASALPLKAGKMNWSEVLNGDREKERQTIGAKLRSKETKSKELPLLQGIYEEQIQICEMGLVGLDINTVKIRDALAKALQGMYEETRVNLHYAQVKSTSQLSSLLSGERKTELLDTPKKVQVPLEKRNREEHATEALLTWVTSLEENLEGEKDKSFESLQLAIATHRESLSQALQKPLRSTILKEAYSLVTSICPLICEIEKLTGKMYQPLVSSSHGLKYEDTSDSKTQKLRNDVVEEDKDESVLINPGQTVVLGSTKLKHTGNPLEVRKENGSIVVTTDHNAFASYQLEGDRVPVKGGQTIEVSYMITVQPKGKMSLGLLNMTRNGWYGAELILTADHEAKTYEGVYKRTVPQGEKETSLVFRNYRLLTNGGAGQSTFFIKALDFKLKDH